MEYRRSAPNCRGWRETRRYQETYIAVLCRACLQTRDESPVQLAIDVSSAAIAAGFRRSESARSSDNAWQDEASRSCTLEHLFKRCWKGNTVSVQRLRRRQADSPAIHNERSARVQLGARAHHVSAGASC